MMAAKLRGAKEGGAGDASAQREEMVLFVCLPSAVEGDADDEGKEDAEGR